MGGGRTSSKRAPPSLCTYTSSIPCAFAYDCAIARPRPLPWPSPPRSNRSNSRGTSSGGTPSPPSSTASAEVAALTVGRDADRGPPVPERVGDDVAEDALERDRVGLGLGCPRRRRARRRRAGRRRRSRRPRATSARTVSGRGLISIARASSRDRSSSCSISTAQPLRLLVEHLAHLRLRLGVQLVVALAQRRREAVDGGGRRAQLVRGDRDEVEPHPVELDDLPVDARLLDRDRGALGDELEQLDVAWEELARVERPDVDDADDAVAELSGAPSSVLIPFSRRIGLRTSAWSTSGSRIGRPRRRSGRRSRGRAGSGRRARPPPRCPSRRGRRGRVALVEQQERGRVGLEVSRIRISSSSSS